MMLFALVEVVMIVVGIVMANRRARTPSRLSVAPATCLIMPWAWYCKLSSTSRLPSVREPVQAKCVPSSPTTTPRRRRVCLNTC